MLDFAVDFQKCIGCGQCAAVCPMGIIAMEERLPVIAQQKEEFCMFCLHCFAVCSDAAISMNGLAPEDVPQLDKKQLPSPEQMELLIRGRRSTRKYQKRAVESEEIDALLNIAWQAPTGRNDRGLCFTVVEKQESLDALREDLIAGIEKHVAEGTLPEVFQEVGFDQIAQAWREGQQDVLFRGAPHALIVSAEEGTATPMQDAIIAMTTFELYAQSKGIGTVWDGLLMMALELVPEAKKNLNLPEKHELCYAMCFGYPALRYARAIDRGTAKINKV